MQNEDFDWFVQNYNDLYKKYGRSFLAIKNKGVLGSYTSYADGVRTMQSREAPGTFIVQECNGDESAYTNYIASTYLA